MKLLYPVCLRGFPGEGEKKKEAEGWLVQFLWNED